MEGGPPSFPQGSTCPVVLRIPLPWGMHFTYGTITPSGTPFHASSAIHTPWYLCGPTTPSIPQNTQPLPLASSIQQKDFVRALWYARFGLFPLRSPLLRESRLISSPPGTEMFHFPGYRFAYLSIQYAMIPYDQDRVSPFGLPRIIACSQLPVAFRSLPRPSSPPDA